MLNKLSIGKTLRLALFETEYGSIWCEEEDYAAGQGAVRLTEVVEVTFAPRKPEEYVPEALAALEKQSQEAQAEYLSKLERINTKRANLLAITHSPAEAATDVEEVFDGKVEPASDEPLLAKQDPTAHAHSEGSPNTSDDDIPF